MLQEKVTSGEMEVVKVPRAENRADALTHPIEASEMQLHLDLIVQVPEIGRHSLAPKVEAWGEEEVQSLAFRGGSRNCATPMVATEAY